MAPLIINLTTKKQLKALEDELGGKLFSGVRGLHFQFQHDGVSDWDVGRPAAIAIAALKPTPNVVVLQASCGKKMKALKALLEDPDITKVLFNVPRVALCLGLYAKQKIAPVKCVDLQLLSEQEETKDANTCTSLFEIASRVCGSEAGALARKVEDYNANNPLAWTSSRSAPEKLDILATSALLHARCYLESSHLHDPAGVIQSTQVLWREAVLRLDASPTSSVCPAPVAISELSQNNRPAKASTAPAKEVEGLITTTEELETLLADYDNKPVVSSSKTIGVYFQFVKEEGGADSLLSVTTGNASSNGSAVTLQIDTLDIAMVFVALKTLLEDSNIVKVAYGLGRVAKWFHRHGLIGVSLEKCVDLQLLYKLLVDASVPDATMVQIASHISATIPVDMAKMVDVYSVHRNPWMKSPLGAKHLKKLVMAEKVFVWCFGRAFKNKDTREAELSRIFAAGNELWTTTFSEFGGQSIALDHPISPAPQIIAASKFTRNETGSLSHCPNQIGTTKNSPSTRANISRTYMYVASDLELQQALESNNDSLVQGSAPVVGVHFQFAREKSPYPGENDDGQLVAISIVGANPLDTAVVLQIDYLNPATVCLALKTLLSDPKTVKVMHDVHRAAFFLHRNGLTDVQLVNCIDLQVVYENVVSTSELHATLLQIVEHCKSVDTMSGLAQTTQSFKTRVKPADPADWGRRPLPESLLRTLANDAQLYAQCYVELNKMSPLMSPYTAACAATTNTRWQYAIANQGHHAIWFDPEADNQPRSLECFHSNDSEGSKTKRLPSGIPPLELQCDLDPLLDLLPSEYEDAILEIDDYHTKLVDVCLDVGRIPYVYTGKKQRVVLSKNGATVSKDTIDEIIANLGGEMRIGDDNRAGIDRQLHRISVMRSKTDEVYGLTMRVGRALRNAACVLTDLLLSARHADKSVLVLGHPGSGKTTLIRDVARCVSETMENVCIIDTSNEIGGDGLVPHECVGWARRMMVRSLEAQAGVMVECVQNHTVETLIVDEIGRKAEVLAASTVRQRGPRLIASAHGDFRALLKNPDLKGLVGGSQQVIVGDSAAAQSATKSKLQTQRAGNPIFDVIVELDHVVRGRCRVIWDVAKAVDSVLEGNGYSFETRQWDASTRGVQVLGV